MVFSLSSLILPSGPHFLIFRSSIEFLYFSVLKFPIVSLYLNFFAETFDFFHLFQACLYCLLKHFYDGTFRNLKH